MTLIVGIRCQDGIVIASDSAATNVTSMGQQTSMQPMDKLDIIAGTVILGVSGPVGLGQLFKAEIERLWIDRAFSDASVSRAMVTLSDAIRAHLGREYGFAGTASQAIGNLALQEIITQTLIAIPIRRVPCLIEFTKTGSPEEKNERLPTVAIGCVQQIVDPFLGFLRRIFWPDRLPSLAEGKLAAYWSLDYGIKSAPGGVGDPKKIVTLEDRGDNWRAYELSEAEINAHAEAVEGVENYIKQYQERDVSGESESTTIPSDEEE